MLRKINDMRIYTKTGDRGETGLFSGKRVPKDSEYIEGYGTVDELNSAIGISLSFITATDLKEILYKIQENLFELGSDLATPFDDTSSKAQKVISRMTERETTRLEKWIDHYDAKLSPLKTFILPGGSHGGAFLHLSRTICRRTERWVTGLTREGKANPFVLIYLNRLSDLLFVLARYCNQLENQIERPWQRKKA